MRLRNLSIEINTRERYCKLKLCTLRTLSIETDTNTRERYCKLKLCTLRTLLIGTNTREHCYKRGNFNFQFQTRISISTTDSSTAPIHRLRSPFVILRCPN